MADVRQDPALFDALIGGMTHADPLIRMRAADAVEKLTIDRPEALAPHIAALLGPIAAQEQQEVRWHVAQLLPRLDLSPAERQTAVEILQAYLADRSAIVKTFAMQGLTDLALADPELQSPVRRTIQKMIQSGSPAVRSRGRKLLKALGKTAG